MIDPLTGEGRSVQIFVAVLGASNFTYAEATFTQTLPDWIGAHGRAFAYLGGTARQTVSDNLKAGVTKACFHEPMVNRTYADLARHYGTAIVPARPYKPRDKAKVEVGVQIVGRWILARLRNRRFFSLAALNEAIRELLAELNERPMRGWACPRRALFEETRTPGPDALPPEPYEYAEWRRCRWARLPCRDRQAPLQRSLPLARQRGRGEDDAAHRRDLPSRKRVASHLRSTRPHRPTTVPEHMPSAHRRYRDWTHERIRREAAKIGADAATLIDLILGSRPHPEQGFRSAIGIVGLVERYGPERVDAACARALALDTRSYTSVAAILNPEPRRRVPAA